MEEEFDRGDRSWGRAYCLDADGLRRTRLLAGGSTPEFWASAYGAIGFLSVGEESGLRKFPDSRYRSGSMEYPEQATARRGGPNDKWELSPRAFACYALAVQRPEAAYHEVLFKGAHPY